jgi:hypothetical protein
MRSSFSEGWRATGEVMIMTIAAKDVGYLQLCLEDGRLSAMKVFFPKGLLFFEPLKSRRRVLLKNAERRNNQA